MKKLSIISILFIILLGGCGNPKSNITNNKKVKFNYIKDQKILKKYKFHLKENFSNNERIKIFVSENTKQNVKTAVAFNLKQRKIGLMTVIGNTKINNLQNQEIKFEYIEKNAEFQLKEVTANKIITDKKQQQKIYQNCVQKITPSMKKIYKYYKIKI